VKLIVGLGNPGVRYRWTRHNVGFQVVDRFALSKEIPISSRRFRAIYGKGSFNDQEIVLLKPLTYMNLSGEAVKRAAQAFRIRLEDLIVVHDDLDLSSGKLRFRQRGGDGGHQGIHSIIEAMGGNGFLRLKIGIGRPPQGMDPADYVLAPLEEPERVEFGAIFSRAAECLTVLLLEGIEAAMSRFQGKPILPSQAP
jgi:PTH1 family peptidyl-tRNA hydrolase